MSHAEFLARYPHGVLTEQEGGVPNDALNWRDATHICRKHRQRERVCADAIWSTSNPPPQRDAGRNRWRRDAVEEEAMLNLAVEEAVAKLNAIDARDPEDAHITADNVLLALVPDEVREAYDRVNARCSWWAYA